MGYDRDGKPDYETWLREKEGNDPYAELQDAVNRTVDSMYDWMDTDSSDDED